MENDLYQFKSTENYSVPIFLLDPVVAMAYVPYQNPKAVYTASFGLKNGTMFPCLNKPFLGKRGYRAWVQKEV